MNPSAAACLATLAVGAPTLAFQQPCETQKLHYGAASQLDLFGTCAAIDGDTAVVGAVGADTLLEDGTGRASVFEYSAGGPGIEAGWQESIVLFPSDGNFLGNFGASAAIDGDTILVGDIDPEQQLGSGVYYYQRENGQWPQSENQKLVPSGSTATSLFGWDVDLDGDLAIVADHEDSTQGVGAGAAYVFERFEFLGSLQWYEQAKLTASDGAPGDDFGRSVAIEGDVAVVGAPSADGIFAASVGAVYVFERAPGPFGLPVWTQAFKIVSPANEDFELFGTDVAIEGERILVGAPKAGDDPGAAYLFERSIFDSWAVTKTFQASGGADRNRFGGSVAIEGDTIVIGANLEKSAGVEIGAFYVFREGPGGWPTIETAQLFAHDGGDFDLFGRDVEISGSRVLSTAYFDDDFGLNSGAAYAFELDASLCGLPHSLSLSAGGSQAFQLTAGPQYSDQIHVLLGTTGGTAPGLAIDGVTLPINVDGPGGWFVLSLQLANSPTLVNTFGLLDGAGEATASLNFSAGSPPGLAGVVLSHAFLVFDVVGGTNAAVFASNPVSLKLVP